MRVCTSCSFTLSEAIALPINVERATQKPTLNMIYSYTTLQAPCSDTIHIHKASTVASFLTLI
ncbi:MAG: hypothetical protein IKL83_03285 [Muribaculaceae bacterium]|nr:hypothetical protein [Muribaculaceae bacterium]